MQPVHTWLLQTSDMLSCDDIISKPKDHWIMFVTFIKRSFATKLENQLFQSCWGKVNFVSIYNKAHILENLVSFLFIWHTVVAQELLNTH